jgi:hypothetical protein
MLTALTGSNRNQVVNVKPFSCGHLAMGGNTRADPASKKYIFIIQIIVQKKIAGTVFTNLYFQGML